MMYITYTGNEVAPNNNNSPHLTDIAVQLGRIVRFAGALEPWWSVLHHVIVCKELITHEPEYHKLTEEGQKLAELHALLHDAHESITSDIPKAWKNEGNKKAQEDLDIRIWAHFNIPAPKGIIKELIHLADWKALNAEGYVLGSSSLSLFFADEADNHACKIVSDISNFYELDNSTSGFRSQLVKDFSVAVSELLEEYNALRYSK